VNVPYIYLILPKSKPEEFLAASYLTQPSIPLSYCFWQLSAAIISFLVVEMLSTSCDPKSGDFFYCTNLPSSTQPSKNSIHPCQISYFVMDCNNLLVEPWSNQIVA